MIKHIESENIVIRTNEDYSIIVDTEAGQLTLTVDQLQEFRNMLDQIWSTNNMWRHTAEAKAEREENGQSRGILSDCAAKSPRY